jgi:hypothetical protein
MHGGHAVVSYSIPRLVIDSESHLFSRRACSIINLHKPTTLYGPDSECMVFEPGDQLEVIYGQLFMSLDE